MDVILIGTGVVPAGRTVVWAALNDVDRLKLCIPGCHRLRRVSDVAFDLAVLVGLGPVKVEFRGRVDIAETDPPNAYRLVGHGEGGLAGLAIGAAHIRLIDVPGGCRLRYTIETEQSGPLSRLSAFFIAGVAKALADRFIATLSETLSIEAPGGRSVGRLPRD